MSFRMMIAGLKLIALTIGAGVFAGFAIVAALNADRSSLPIRRYPGDL